MSNQVTLFSNFVQFKTLRVEEYRLTLKNLEQHYQAFIRDSQDSELFGADDRLQAENSYSKATQHYDNLLRSVEQGGCPIRSVGLFRNHSSLSQFNEIAHIQSHLGPSKHPCFNTLRFFCMLVTTQRHYDLQAYDFQDGAGQGIPSDSHYDCETYFSEHVLIQKDSALGKDPRVDFLTNCE